MQSIEFEARYVHTNIISRDWKRLSEFYIKVFECKLQYPERHLYGKWIDDATGLKDVRIDGIQLQLPGFSQNAPTLEIFQYNECRDDSKKSVNRTGYAHIAFSVSDVEAALKAVLDNGGSRLGRVIRQEIASAGIVTFVYARDPEGNIIELQSWSK